MAADANATQDVTPPPPVSRAVLPQIVRLSFVQGDVRVSLGKQGKHDGDAPWEQAAVNLPLQTGFSLVTGKGRAEIEFEDASTMYLGEDSVLTFNNLTSKENVPHTEMALLTGVATLDLQPTVPGEVYLLETPTDSLHVRFGQRAEMRVNSYLDAMSLTPLVHSSVQMGHFEPVQASLGRTFTYSYGVRVAATHPAANDFAEWDGWVANRVASRATAMSAVMKESGLGVPLAGMEDMNAQGKFFPCEPYGTCWVPNNGWGGERAGLARQDAAATQTTATQKPKKQDQQTSGGYGSVPSMLYDDEYAFPCSPYGGFGMLESDPARLQDASLDNDFMWDAYPYDWAVCHAGSWIRYGRRYAWVVGVNKHHHCPVRWVTSGGKLGYVPIHPKDVAGKTPLNLKHGLYIAVDRKNHSFERTKFDSTTPVKVLEGTPREFRRPALPGLRAAAAPVVEAHAWSETLAGVKTPLAARPVNTIAFDHRSQSFTLVTRVNEGGRSSTFTNTMGGRVGTSQPSGPMLAGGYRGGATGDGGRGGFCGGSASGSGGSRGSSGSSSSSSGSGSSSGASSSSAGSSGGGHPR